MAWLHRRESIISSIIRHAVSVLLHSHISASPDSPRLSTLFAILGDAASACVIILINVSAITIGENAPSARAKEKGGKGMEEKKKRR